MKVLNYEVFQNKHYGHLKNGKLKSQSSHLNSHSNHSEAKQEAFFENKQEQVNAINEKETQWPLRASVLIGFYKNIYFLECVLASLEIQTVKDFEVIICDDGSGEEIKNKIHALMKDSSLPIKHIYHNDDGFRKVESLNKGALNTNSDYLIFIDQDCVLHSRFIEEHIQNRGQGKVLSGRRVELPKWISELITPKRIKDLFIERNYYWILLFVFLINKTWKRGFYFKNPFLRRILNRRVRPVFGCNYSIFKEDFIAVNGFDMTYNVSCGAEDSDAGPRFLLKGYEIQSIINIAVQYHLYHPIRGAPAGDDYGDNFKKNRDEKIVYVKNGYDLIPKVEIKEL